MGSGESKTPEEVLEKPWKNINWERKKDLVNDIKSFKPSTDEVSHVRILLYGPVGAGKSSFVNSVSTVLLGRSANSAHNNTSTDGVKSFTIEYKTHKIRKEKPSTEFFPFVFSDIMGLDATKGFGIRVEDVIMVMKGCVNEGYKFNPVSSLSVTNSQYYNPSADNRVHLLVCVLNGNAPEINPAVIEQIKEIRGAARDLGIPNVAIFTHIDLISKEIKSDVKKVFEMKHLLKKVEEFSVATGFDKSHIFPVRNYCDGLMEAHDDVDTLILSSFKHMLNYADDFINAS